MVSTPGANTPHTAGGPEEAALPVRRGLKAAPRGFRGQWGWSTCWSEPGSAYEMVSSSFLREHFFVWT